MSRVSSNEALSLLRKIAFGKTVPGLKNPLQSTNDSTIELSVDGWTMVVFTDDSRHNHLDTVTSPDGRQGGFEDWRSNEEFSQQPEDRLHREDNGAVNRMFLACQRAR